jgi:pimeloyl-ACP methyl ester carboxylesterase
MKVLYGILLLVVVTLLAGGAWLYTPDKTRAALEAEYAAPPSEFLSVAGLRLHVRDTGPKRAPAIILLHGFASSLHTWEPWAHGLSANFRVIRYDLPGFGLTGPDPTGDYSDARSEAVLAALMDTLGVRQATLVGNSMGGKLAWQFAARHPERTDKLVLISPDGFSSPGFEYGKTPDVPWMVRLLPYMLPTALVRMSLAPAYGDPAALTDALLARYRDMMLVPGVRDAMIARMRQVDLQPPEPLLRQIKAPTLLIWGERDGMIPFSNSQDYAAALANARIVAFPDLGHVPMEEAPARSLAPVLEFLAPASGGAAGVLGGVAGGNDVQR